jgi:hypothetical protein
MASNFASRFAESSKGQFGFGRMSGFDPFKRAKSLLAYKMSWSLFIPMVLINGAILSAVLVAFALELATTFQHWSLKSASYDDAMSYSLFVLDVPIFVLSIGCLLAAIGGRLFFIDFVGQLVFFIAVLLCNIVGWFGGIVALIVSFGRYDSCRKSESATAFCHDEKGALLAVGIITLIILLLALLGDLVIATLMLFVKPLQYAAIGMDSWTMGQMKKANQSGNGANAAAVFNRWLENKQRTDAGFKAKKRIMANGEEERSDDDSTDAGEVEGLIVASYAMAPATANYSGDSSSSGPRERVTQAHRAVAKLAVQNSK